MFSSTLMTPPLWKPEYALGHPILDQHHMRMLELIEEIGEAIRSESEFMARQTIADLLHYTQVHHAEEERLLHEVGYPAAELLEHKHSHRRMAEHVRSCQAQLRQQTAALAMAPEIERYMHGWLLHHILQEDQEFASWLQPSAGSRLQRRLPAWMQRLLYGRNTRT